MQFCLKYIFVFLIQILAISGFSQVNYKVELINSYTDNALIIYQSNFSETKIRKDLASLYQIDTNDVIVSFDSEKPLIIYTMGDFKIAINEQGNIIAKNITNEEATWVDLKQSFDKNSLEENTYFIAKEESEGLVITYKNWVTNDLKKPSKKISKTISSVTIPFDDIYYHADGKLSPSEISALTELIKYSPEDRKVTYEFDIIIPKELFNAVPIMIELCTKEGYQLRMIGKVDKEIMKVMRENLAPNTYLLKFYNGDTKEEITRTLLFMLPIKEDHGIDTK